MLFGNTHYHYNITWNVRFVHRYALHFTLYFTVVDTWATVWWCAFTKSCAADRWSWHAVRSRDRMLFGIHQKRRWFLQPKHLFCVDLSRNSPDIEAQKTRRCCLKTHIITTISLEMCVLVHIYALFVTLYFTVVDTWTTVWWCAFTTFCAVDRWRSTRANTQTFLDPKAWGNVVVFNKNSSRKH